MLSVILLKRVCSYHQKTSSVLSYNIYINIFAGIMDIDSITYALLGAQNIFYNRYR